MQELNDKALDESTENGIVQLDKKIIRDNELLTKVRYQKHI